MTYLHAVSARGLAALFAAALLAGAPRPATAQFGGLLKKAAEKAGEKAVDKATGAEDRVSPRVNGTELTDDAVNRLLKGLSVTAAKMTERDELQERVDASNKVVAELREPNEAAISSWESAHGTWRDCFDNQMTKFSKAHEGQMKVGMMKLMADPKKAQSYSALLQKYSAEQQAAMAAGDTLKLTSATAALQRAVYLMMGVDLAVDSAKARGSCGAEPKKLAVMAKLEGLEAQRDTLQVKVRDLESTAQFAGAQAAGMPLQEFSLQREKASLFLRNGHGGNLLTREELNRLRAKRAEIEKVKKAF